MYADPRNIRKNAIKISLNDLENELIQAQAAYTGEQPAVLVRKLVLMGLERLHGGLDSSESRSEMPRGHFSHFAA